MTFHWQEIAFFVGTAMTILHAVASWAGLDAEWNSKAALTWFAVTAVEGCLLLAGCTL